MAKLYYKGDLNILKGRRIAVIGYGIQGRAQALNMRDSGLDVVLGLRPNGKSWSQAVSEGFKVYPIDEAVKASDVVLMLIPDMIQPEVYRSSVGGNLKPGMALGFAHGFNIHYNLIKPPGYVDVFMVAPKAPGAKVREEYVNGRGVPSLIAVYQNHTGKALEIALAIAEAIGSTRAGVIETTFKEETETDLIGEQIVLVGGLIELIRKGFECLTEFGYQPEVAYFEVLNEAKLIMDLIWAKGLVGMLERVSETARYGGLSVGPKVIDEHVKENMRKAALNVINGSFAEEWVKEYRGGSENLNRLLNELRKHRIEIVGEQLRRMMKFNT